MSENQAARFCPVPVFSYGKNWDWTGSYIMPFNVFGVNKEFSG
ncbi:hypothetical protein LBBP_00113 [Leptospira borgpetersenii serovar Ballum]|uniref:Uncharacterized protein n=1 Tax=Leptospira borgpetersenii serovar Ballum TaxID=280505 RepID=A0A0S2ILW4_LEPBO|nr:hypothetical protein LBBP_00113 [Leptospira borgpetersenii serovar Ballum]